MNDAYDIQTLIADRLTPAQAAEILGISEYTFRKR